MSAVPFLLECTTALVGLSLAHREHVGNAICAYNLTLPCELLTHLIVGDAFLQGELFLTERTRQQSLQALRLIVYYLRGSAALAATPARHSRSFLRPMVIIPVAGHMICTPQK
eukprot:3561395-Pyramimonas_sp.AAC.1